MQDASYSVNRAMPINSLQRRPEDDRDLGRLDNAWSGWTLWKGRLYDPQSSAVEGFRPEDVRVVPILRQQISALEAELRMRPGRRVPPSPRLTQLEALREAIARLMADIARNGTADELAVLRLELAGRPPLAATPETATQPTDHSWPNPSR